MLFARQISRTFRIRNINQPGVLARALRVVADKGAIVGDIRVVHFGSHYVIRDIDVFSDTENIFDEISTALEEMEGVELLEIRDEILAAHLDGKLEVRSRMSVRSQSDLRKVYTPGVANVCRVLLKNPELADVYTWRRKVVAIITNGTRVLGLGNIGIVASLPVMEGKAALLNQLVGLYGIPILVNTRDVDEFVELVVKISESFGAIHLEDIETPACFEIEAKLVERLEKPVMHDDQHGTAVAALAAAINACGKAKVNINRISFGIVGLGAAGFAIARLLMEYTGRSVLGYDIKEDAARRLEAAGGKAAEGIREIFAEADFVVLTTGVSNLVNEEWIKEGQIVFSLTNPEPEISPEKAVAAGAAFAADGKMINNILAYPGVFKGAIKARATRITSDMLIAAAETIARCTPADDLLPDPLNIEVHRRVSQAVAMSAQRCGVARVDLDEEIPGGGRAHT